VELPTILVLANNMYHDFVMSSFFHDLRKLFLAESQVSEI
jgi:hypothetical protein